MAGTWDFEAGRMEVYIDGKRVAEVRDDALKKKWNKMPGSFQVGPYKGIKHPGTKGSDTKNVVIDDLLLFDHRLRAAEIAELAGIGASANYDRRKQYRLPLVTVPRTGKPPAIDGSIGGGEWDAAGAVGGFITIGNTRGTGFLAPDDVTARIAYDDTYLYALFITPLDKMPPPHTGTGDHYDKDLDMIEFWIAPQREKGHVFQFIGMPSGASLDTRNNQGEWNGKWDFGNGLADGRWIAEIRIAFKELGIAPPKKGDEWGMNFCRSYPRDSRATCWSDTVVRYATPTRLDRARFDDAALQIITDVSDMTAGKIGWRYLASNPSPNPIRIELDIQNRLDPVYFTDAAAGDGMTTAAVGSLFQKTIASALEPGRKAEARPEDHFQERGSRFYSVAAFSVPERTPLFEQLIPISPASGELLFVTANTLYGAGKVLVNVEAGSLRAQTRGDLKLNVSLKRDGKEIAAAQLPLTKDVNDIRLEPKPWQAGDYQVAVSALKGGDVLAATSKSLRIEPTPVWWDNDIGKRDVVQPPYEPIRVRRNRINVWGRQYRIARTGLPMQITTQDLDLLAHPAKLRLGPGGPDVRGARLKRTTLKDTRAIYEMSGTLGPYQVTGNIEAMYDGIIEYDYTLTPPARQARPVMSPGLVLEIPIRREVAKYLVRRAPTNEPRDGAPFMIKDGLTLPFSHSLWVGDIAHGLSWYTDTDEGWTAPKEQRVEVRVPPNGGTALLRIHILRAGRAPSLRLRFGLIATPFRPLPKDWRRIRFHSLRGAFPQYWDTGTLMKTETGRAFLYGRSPLDKKPNGEFVLPAKERDWLEKLVNWVHSKDARFILYSPGHATIKGSKTYETYHTEWNMLPLQSMDPGRVTYFFFVCPKSRHQDWFFWNLDRMIKAGKLDGVYFDQGAPDECKNALHGCGYQDGAVRRRTQTIRAQREFYRRARQVFLDNGKEPILVAHTSNQVLPANYTHLDVLFNGEQFHSNFSHNDYLRMIDEHMLQVQWSSKLMGVPVVFLPEFLWFQIKQERWNWRRLWEVELQGERACAPTRGLMALLLPNDMLYGGGLIHIPLSKRVWEIWDTLGDATYVSHRDAGLSTEPGPPRIQAGLYVQPNGEALLAVGNLNEEPATVSVTIDAKRVTLHGLRADDVLDRKPAAPQGQTVRLDVGGKDFRLILLKK